MMESGNRIALPRTFVSKRKRDCSLSIHIWDYVATWQGRAGRGWMLEGPQRGQHVIP